MKDIKKRARTSNPNSTKSKDRVDKYKLIIIKKISLLKCLKRSVRLLDNNSKKPSPKCRKNSIRPSNNIII